MHLGCTGWSSQSCDDYLLCVSATMPLAQSDQLALYGKNGSCWSQVDPEQCARACEAGLKALAQTTSAKECHPADGLAGNPNPTPQTFNWPLPPKPVHYSGPSMDPMLSGTDPLSGQWRCTRDDTNPNPSAAVLAQGEPNDYPDQAIAVANPLPVDLPPTEMGSSFQICPDKSNPGQPDVDAYKFTLTASSNVVAQITYDVTYGDLDMAVFRSNGVNSQTGLYDVDLVMADVTPVSNACVQTILSPGDYFVLVYGALEGQPLSVAMNNYQFRVFAVQSSGYTCP